jgi:hypothetical protein
MHDQPAKHEIWIAFLLGVFPPAGLLLAAAMTLLHRTSWFTRAWILLWLGFGLPLALYQLILGRNSSALEIALLSGAGLAASGLLWIKRQHVVIGLTWSLALLSFLAIINVALDSFTWSNTRIGQSALSSLTSLEGSKTRRWLIPNGTDNPQLSFAVRTLGGTQGLSWYRSHPAIKLSHDLEDSFTDISFPGHLDPYVMRWVDTEEPLGGRVFQASIELRSEEPIPSNGKRGLWLQVWDKESAPSAVLPIATSNSWSNFTLTWTVPPEVSDSVIRLALNDFDGLSIDVRNVRLQEFRGGAWVELSPLSPTGLTATLETGGTARRLSVLPTIDMKHYTLSLEGDSANWASVTFVAEGDTRVKLSDIKVNLASGPIWPWPMFKREQLWYTDPNLMGHSITIIGLVLLMLSVPTTGILSYSGATLLLVGLTGSRTAWLAASIGVLWTLVMARRLQAVRIILMLGALSIGVVSLLGLENLGRLASLTQDVTTSRSLIWSTAWQALLERPLQGLGSSGFAGYFQEAQATSSNEPISHAHNLWLHFAASYGIPGILAILWLTGGLTWLSWQHGRWRGLSLIIPIFILNCFDLTFFFHGALYPVILGLNTLQLSNKQLSDPAL